MGVKSPFEISKTFGDLFNARDREGLLALYTADGILTIDGETLAQGASAIGEMMAEMLDSPLKIKTHQATCHVNGDIALVRTDWTLIDPDGKEFMTGSSAEILGRQDDGLWRFIIDDASFSSRLAAS
jgi:uncharacterized protein (TIGR02246 family)